MSKNPFFSIIMPYYRNFKVIERSVSSVINQTYRNFELIIINDGDDDGVNNYVCSLDDARIRLVSQNHGGVSKARNRGINESIFDWVCFLDSDDEWSNNHLETLVDLICKFDGLDMYLTSYQRVESVIERPINGLPSNYPSSFITNDLMGIIMNYGHIIHTNSVCLRKSFAIKVGLFDEESSKGEDLDFWYRCSLYSDVAISRRITTSYYRDASYLTRTSSHVEDWVLSRRDYLFNDNAIPVEKKKSLLLIIKRYELSQIKHMIAQGDKKAAKAKYKRIKDSIPSRLCKSRREAAFLLLLPNCISKAICSHIYSKMKNM